MKKLYYNSRYTWTTSSVLTWIYLLCDEVCKPNNRSLLFFVRHPVSRICLKTQRKKYEIATGLDLFKIFENILRCLNILSSSLSHYTWASKTENKLSVFSRGALWTHSAMITPNLIFAKRKTNFQPRCLIWPQPDDHDHDHDHDHSGNSFAKLRGILPRRGTSGKKFCHDELLQK